jgi:hypothetical protein
VCPEKAAEFAKRLESCKAENKKAAAVAAAHNKKLKMDLEKGILK